MSWMSLMVRGCGLLACAVVLSGCFTSGEGREPHPDRLYFPTGLVVSPGGTTLYVANSDFDLQFSGGSVQALDLRAIRGDTRVIAEAIAGGASASEACVAASLQPNLNPWLQPGPCGAFVLAPYVEQFAFIGAFASGLLLAHDPLGNRARLFAPVRGDPSITFFEVEDDRAADAGFSPSFELDCLQLDTGFCNVIHRLGQDPDRNLRGVQLPADPVGIAATADGQAIVSAHQTQGAASLLINNWDSSPQLAFSIRNLPTGPTEVAAVPEPAFVAVAEAEAAAMGRFFTYERGFAVTFRAAAEIDVLRFVPDAGAAPARPFLTRSTAQAVSANTSAFDSRGIAILDSERRACEATCAGAVNALACLAACAEEIPLRVFMANRDPASLLIGQMDTFITRTMDGELSSATETVLFYDSIPLNFGPSRLEIGSIVNADGALEDRVFAVAFDARTVFMFHPLEHRVEAVIRTGRGPHDIATDTGTDDQGNAFSFLHVGHFTDSYIGVVDLDQRRPLTYAQMFATVGTPTPPTESN